MNYHDYLPTLVTACSLILLLTLESWLPNIGLTPMAQIFALAASHLSRRRDVASRRCER